MEIFDPIKSKKFAPECRIGGLVGRFRTTFVMPLILRLLKKAFLPIIGQAGNG
jgi:hypothetical protein